LYGADGRSAVAVGASVAWEQSSYSSHVPFSVGRNTKSMHHVWCLLFASKHAYLQSASVAFLPTSAKKRS